MRGILACFVSGEGLLLTDGFGHVDFACFVSGEGLLLTDDIGHGNLLGYLIPSGQTYRVSFYVHVFRAHPNLITRNSLVK